MNKKTFCFIFARGGSKGIPKKNILPISGLPLLVHSINLAKKLDEVDKIFVSTDCPEISEIAFKNNVEVIKRPLNLAQDDSSEWLAWQHAIKYVEKNQQKFDRFLSLPTTAPLRNKNDVQRCLEALDKNVDLVLTMSKANRSPWFNMVTSDESSKVNLIFHDPKINRRQDTPSCYDLTTIAYVSRPEFIMKSSSMWEGNVHGVEIPSERCIDIDNPLDYLVAKFLMENGHIPNFLNQN
tara:strand:+ start:439 stop:1152 length:714 start_codon:yes stop_codon:yes gene_type:complete